MSVKGSWSRITNTKRYERNKERIYMDTPALHKFLEKRCLQLMPGGSTTMHPRLMWVYEQMKAIATDVTDVAAHPEWDEAKALRRIIMDLHEKLDEEEDSHGQT